MKLSLPFVTVLLATTSAVVAKAAPAADADAMDVAMAVAAPSPDTTDINAYIALANSLLQVSKLLNNYDPATAEQKRGLFSWFVTPVLTTVFQLLGNSGIVEPFIKLLLTDPTIEPIFYEVLKQLLLSGLISKETVVGLLSKSK